MKREEIYNGMTDIRDDLIEEADRKAPKKQAQFPKKKYWGAAIAAILAVSFTAGLLLWPSGNTPASISTAYAVAEAQYPEMAPYPDESILMENPDNTDAFDEAFDAWYDSLAAQQRPSGYADGLDPFLLESIRQILGGAEAENRVYSPLNLFMALGMLAEITDNNSRQQILDTLGSRDIEHLRQQAADIWNATYRQDGAVSSVLANSLWLNDTVDFQKDTLERIAKQYYASSYQGEMGSDAFNEALQSWMNEQTGGLLEDQISNLSMTPQTVLTIAETLFFQAKWVDEFDPDQTEKQTFHALSGDIDCAFMYQSTDQEYYWGDQFSAVEQSLENGGSMLFLLPDEGTSPEALLSDPQAMEFLLHPGRWDNHKFLIVNEAIPKFDVSSQLDLSNQLKALGITDVFDSATADFSPLTKNEEEVFLSDVNHGVRVKIDEEGCTAAAYTKMSMDGSCAPPEEEVDFIVNRPFLFSVTNPDGLPMFIGIVHQPSEA